jgi:hypothetical protein
MDLRINQNLYSLNNFNETINFISVFYTLQKKHQNSKLEHQLNRLIFLMQLIYIF